MNKFKKGFTLLELIFVIALFSFFIYNINEKENNNIKYNEQKKTIENMTSDANLLIDRSKKNI